MRRRWGTAALIVSGVLAVCTLLYFTQREAKTVVTFDDYSFNAVVADSEDERSKGLSGSQELAENEGMLFVFPSDGQYGFWMKDMNYPIDIVWLDSQKRIVDIKADAEPSSYPESFRPRSPARYVVELKAGMAAERNLSIGDQAVF